MAVNSLTSEARPSPADEASPALLNFSTVASRRETLSRSSANSDAVELIGKGTYPDENPGNLLLQASIRYLNGWADGSHRL